MLNIATAIAIKPSDIANKLSAIDLPIHLTDPTKLRSINWNWLLAELISTMAAKLWVFVLFDIRLAVAPALPNDPDLAKLAGLLNSIVCFSQCFQDRRVQESRVRIASCKISGES